MPTRFLGVRSFSNPLWSVGMCVDLSCDGCSQSPICGDVRHGHFSLMTLSTTAGNCLRCGQVMTGPGLRVRKHHRAGKGSSGLRVLRYSEEDDSLVWDSHKILGAPQHVLPLSDVEVSRGAERCVGTIFASIFVRWHLRS